MRSTAAEGIQIITANSGPSQWIFCRTGRQSKKCFGHMIKKLYYSMPYESRRRVFAMVRPKKFEQLQNLRRAEPEDGYSLRPFDRQKSIFVHIPKAAGISVCRSLFNSLCGAHTTMRAYQVIFSKQEFDLYFKFSFVRNPWDRLFSAYNFLIQGGRSPGDRKWSEENLRAFPDFNSFVRGWVTVKNIWTYMHFQPQYQFLRIPGDDRLQVDFLGFYENIEEDFSYVARRLALDPLPALSHHNETEGQSFSYRDAYTKETREIVEDVYADDIRTFGYDFDSYSLDSQLQQRKGETTDL